VHRGLAVIDRESAKLTRLVEQLLNLSQLDSGQLDLHVQWSDVAKLVREQARGAQVRTPRATIRVEGPDALMANVDPTRLGQIVANLLDNAAKHTPIDRMIDIRLDDATDVLRIAVRDYGPGIPIERRAGLFQRNPPAEVHNQTAGLGLGLYLTRRLVELHGGTVGVDFPPEGGACFWVQLPAGEPAHGQETAQLSAS
jgi:K+-sensing histidine kinase KdpD